MRERRRAVSAEKKTVDAYANRQVVPEQIDMPTRPDQHAGQFHIKTVTADIY